ncbi:MAG: fold metallo-hydrolase, partial [Solirubrobacterales bacterium]|nr:fold metallo-hydrolase [Solirubrobacterales bacterium]
GIARIVEPDRDLVEGVEIETDLGRWTVTETPGHAPSHVCLYQPERRLLISGDHLLGRVAPYFELGYTPDPVGEFLDSLDKVERLGARLTMSGHGRTFSDVDAHIAANRAAVAERLTRSVDALAEHGPLTVFDAVPHVFGEPMSPMHVNRLNEALSYLTHLEKLGRVVRIPGEDGGPERWSPQA